MVIDEPNEEEQAHSSYAQDVAKEILTEILPYLNIYPDEELTQTPKEGDESGGDTPEGDQGAGEGASGEGEPEGEGASGGSGPEGDGGSPGSVPEDGYGDIFEE